MDWTIIANTAVTVLLPIVISTIGTLAAIGVKRYNAWIQSRDMGERLKTALIQVSAATVSAVADLEKTVRPYMSDGKLTKAEQTEIKALAMQRINTQVPNALQVLATAGMEDLETFLAGRIEHEVIQLPESTKSEVRDQRSEVI